MERKIRKKNMVYPVFAGIVCVIGFFYLHCKGWGKQSILLVPVFALSIYRVYKNIFDAQKDNVNELQSTVKMGSLLAASCNMVVLFLLCVQKFCNMQELYYIIIFASLISVIFSWCVFFNK